MDLDQLPKLAQPAPSRFPHRRSALRAIVWSGAEFHAAKEALSQVLLGNASPPAAGRLGEFELWEVAGLPEELRGLGRWFDDRYRAHAPPVALLHLDRFVEIWRFLERHRERLLAAGLIAMDPTEGTSVSPELLTALVSVAYRPGFLVRPEERSIGSYEDVLALTRAARSGQLSVAEFERYVPATESSSDGDADAFDPDEFRVALQTFYTLRACPLEELHAMAERLSDGDGLGEELPGESLREAVFVAWFAERFAGRDRVEALYKRFLVVAGFIDAHVDQLAELGFVECREGRLAVTGSLFSVLNHLPVVEVDADGVALPAFADVVAAAYAHRRRVGDGVIVRRRGPSGSRWQAKPVAARNQRCPCGSGRKFKRCCGPSVN